MNQDGREPLDPELKRRIEARHEESLEGIEVRNPSTWADESVALEHALRRMKLTGDPTHVITFTVFTGTDEDWTEIYNALDRIVRKLGPNQLRVALMSSLVEEDPDEDVLECNVPSHQETHTEDTPYKVRRALQSIGLGEEGVFNCINAMQDEGILFRERRREFVESGDDGHSRVRVEPLEILGDALYIHNKVWESLKEAGITGSLLERCIETMSNNGIVFRERRQ